MTEHAQPEPLDDDYTLPAALAAELNAVKRDLVLAVISDSDPLAQLRAVKTSAKRMAVPTRHSGVPWQIVRDQLFEQAENSGIVAELGELTIATALEKALKPANGHAVELDPPPEDWEAPTAIPESQDRAAAPEQVPAAPPPPLTIEEWLDRNLPAPDFIMGDWLTTTSRVLLVGETGLGKTNFALALALRIAAGADFLHWRGRRPCRVLYIDGEMSRRLLKQRIADAVARTGDHPAGFHALSHEDIEGWAPLNTPAGQACVEKIIRQIGKVDFIVFDAIMCLLAGDMKDGEPWSQVMPWVRSLTKLNIGQAWLHHTGHDASRSYGDKTKEWQMDTVAHMQAVENAETDVSFSLEFRKARERKPDTRADFQTTRIALLGDAWRSEATATAAKGHVSPLGLKFMAALQNVLASGSTPRNGRPSTTLELWRAECARMGLVDPAKADSARALFNKHRRELIAENHVVCDDEFAWLTR